MGAFLLQGNTLQRHASQEMGEQLPYSKGKQASPKDLNQATTVLFWSQTQTWCSKTSLETLGNEAEPPSYAQKETAVHKDTFLHMY